MKSFPFRCSPWQLYYQHFLYQSSSPHRIYSVTFHPAPAPLPLLCVKSCSVLLAIYLSVCLPVSTSLCVSVWSFVCLCVRLDVCLVCLSPSVAWASVALHEMNALFPPRFQMWCSVWTMAASRPTNLCSSPAATGWLQCSVAPSWKATLRR